MDESIKIIEELLDCIGWLGGDSYETEAAQQMCKNAHDFLAKHKMPEINHNIPLGYEPPVKLPYNHLVFIFRDDPIRFILARNKHEARNKSGTTMKNLKCVTSWYNLHKSEKPFLIGEFAIII